MVRKSLFFEIRHQLSQLQIILINLYAFFSYIISSRFCILSIQLLFDTRITTRGNLIKFLSNVKGMKIRKNMAINFWPLNRSFSHASEEMKLEDRIPRKSRYFIYLFIPNVFCAFSPSSIFHEYINLPSVIIIIFVPIFLNTFFLTVTTITTIIIIITITILIAYSDFISVFSNILIVLNFMRRSRRLLLLTLLMRNILSWFLSNFLYINFTCSFSVINNTSGWYSVCNMQSTRWMLCTFVQYMLFGF